MVFSYFRMTKITNFQATYSFWVHLRGALAVARSGLQDLLLRFGILWTTLILLFLQSPDQGLFFYSSKNGIVMLFRFIRVFPYQSMI